MPANAGISLTAAQLALLRSARESLGLTQGQAAVKLGVSRIAVVRYESGLMRPGIGVLRAWAALLGYGVEELGVELKKVEKKQQRRMVR